MHTTATHPPDFTALFSRARVLAKDFDEALAAIEESSSAADGSNDVARALKETREKVEGAASALSRLGDATSAAGRPFKTARHEPAWELWLHGGPETAQVLNGLAGTKGEKLRSMYCTLYGAEEVAAFAQLALPALKDLEVYVIELEDDEEIFEIGFEQFRLPRLRRLIYRGKILQGFFITLDASSFSLEHIDLAPFAADEALELPDRILVAIRSFGPPIDVSDGTAALVRKSTFRPSVLCLTDMNEFDTEWAGLCGERWIGGLSELRVRSFPTRLLAKALPSWFPTLKI
ncbi:hypothetical protein DFJ74DRAFT_701510 [Hyaloraphidium curvatum]|nr:hypothetical protein DFJ74DRAFT_701510 [Hyaloraphidium curvatum]